MMHQPQCYQREGRRIIKNELLRIQSCTCTAGNQRRVGCRRPTTTLVCTCTFLLSTLSLLATSLCLRHEQPDPCLKQLARDEIAGSLPFIGFSHWMDGFYSPLGNRAVPSPTAKRFHLGKMINMEVRRYGTPKFAYLFDFQVLTFQMFLITTNSFH